MTELLLRGDNMREAYANECAYFRKKTELLEKDNAKLRTLYMDLSVENRRLNIKLKEVTQSLDDMVDKYLIKEEK